MAGFPDNIPMGWRYIVGFTLLLIVIIGALFIWNDHAIAPAGQRPIDPPSVPNRYTCPAEPYVNCMPIIAPDRQWMCEQEYLQWATENCPGFQGAAY